MTLASSKLHAALGPLFTQEATLFGNWRYTGGTGPRLDDIQQDAFAEITAKINAGSYKYESCGCPCGQCHDEVISLRDYYGLPLRVVICAACGLMRVNPRLDNASLTDFYMSAYRRLHDGRRIATDGALEHFEMNRVRGSAIRDFIYPYISLAPGDRVYEIGCASGGILSIFQELGCQVVGCDPGGQFFDPGRQRGLTLLEGTSEVLHPYGQADLIILSHVLEHVSDPVDFVRNVRELLRPGGMLYIQVPGIMVDHPGFIGQSFLRMIIFPHLFYFCQATLQQTAFRAGFSVVAGSERAEVLLKPGASLPDASDAGVAKIILERLRYMESAATPPDRENAAGTGNDGPWTARARQFIRRILGGARSLASRSQGD